MATARNEEHNFNQNKKLRTESTHTQNNRIRHESNRKQSENEIFGWTNSKITVGKWRIEKKYGEKMCF